MNVFDFKKEIGQYIDASYEDFVNYQKVALGQLKEFDRICKLHDIPYFLAYGTLLGSVRDGNCIPWDYDIDVCVPIIFRDKLIEAFSQSLGEEYFYSYKTNVKNQCAACLRLCQREYVETALHIDVYFIIGASQNEEKAKKLKRLLFWTIKMRLLKYYDNYYWGEQQGQNILRKISKLRYKLIPASILSNIEEKLYFKYDYSTSKYVILTCDVYDRIYPASIFEGSVEMKLNDFVFKVPSGYESFLTITYRDYKKYYPIKNRFEEFYKMYNVIVDRQTHYKQSANRKK